MIELFFSVVILVYSTVGSADPEGHSKNQIGSVREQGKRFTSIEGIEHTKTDLAAVIICARKIIEKNIEGERGVDIAGGFLEAAKRHATDREALRRSGKNCDRIVDSFPSKKVTRETQLKAVARLGTNVSVGTKNLLQEFIKPTITCYKGGAAGTIGVLFVGTGVKAEVNFICTGTNGRKWTGVTVGIGHRFMGKWGKTDTGIGVQADFNGGKMVEQGFYKKSFLDFSTSSSESFAVVLSERREAPEAIKRNDSYNGISLKLKKATVVGLGIGIGETLINFGNMNIKLIPWGTSEKILIDSLLGGSV